VNREIGSFVLEVIEGDITRADTDAIVNAANNHLWMGAGVAGAIKRAGGPEVEREAVAKGPVPVGTAVETTAGNLPHQYVIHGAVMGQDLQTDASLIAQTTKSCLDLADELGLGSVALPAFGTGVGGFPLDDCATIMVREVVGFATRAKSVRRVALVLYGQAACLAFQRAASAGLDG
jgi:O-acetyl-ADP-ribose deacetylase (regulator of RNase III)